MKIVIAILVFFLTFAGVLLGILAATGNLSKEGMDKLTGKAPKEVALPPQAPDNLDAVARELKRREEDIVEREKKVKEAEDRLLAAQRDLDELRTSLQQILKEVTSSLDQADQSQEARLQAAADTVANMDAAKAAKALESFAPAEIAIILTKITKERDRGAIMDEMDPKKAAEVLRSLQENGM